ncbi:MAG: DUF481 domain-containing protein, partial [Steroidobacteraceae bacterium]
SSTSHRLRKRLTRHRDPHRSQAGQRQVVSAGLDYQQQLTKTTKLTDKLLVQAGGQNTAVGNDFAVSVSMTDSLSLSVGYGLRYNSNPPPGSKTTDEFTTLNLVYSFNSPTKK